MLRLVNSLASQSSATPQQILPNEEWKVVPEHLSSYIYLEGNRTVQVSSFGRLRRDFKNGWRYSELYGNKQKKFFLLHSLFKIGPAVILPSKEDVKAQKEIAQEKPKGILSWIRCVHCRNRAMKNKTVCYDCRNK